MKAKLPASVRALCRARSGHPTATRTAKMQRDHRLLDHLCLRILPVLGRTSIRASSNDAAPNAKVPRPFTGRALQSPPAHLPDRGRRLPSQSPDTMFIGASSGRLQSYLPRRAEEAPPIASQRQSLAPHSRRSRRFSRAEARKGSAPPIYPGPGQPRAGSHDAGAPGRGARHPRQFARPTPHGSGECSPRSQRSSRSRVTAPSRRD
jgi:hypothetical protein